MVSNEKRVRRALTYINGSSLQRYFSQRVLSIMIQHLFRLWFWWNNDGILLSGVPDYFGRNKISSGGDLSHYSSASLY